MSMHNFILILHILSALLWAIVHTYRIALYMPKIIMGKNTCVSAGAYNSSGGIERAMLLLLAVSGIVLVLLSGVSTEEWFLFDSVVQRSVSVKLILLLLIIAFRLSIRYSIIPKIKSGETNMFPLIYHIILIIALTILLLLSSFILRL